MRHIVLDTSCLIDLGKADLLDAALALPYVFVMPDILFENEWTHPHEQDEKFLHASRLDVRELSGSDVKRAKAYLNRHRTLKINDCFLLAMSKSLDDSILLTGDRTLRTVAERNGVEVHGVLWIIDEMESRKTVSLRNLYDALWLFHDDPRVFLPTDEVMQRIRRMEKHLPAYPLPLKCSAVD